MAVSSGLQGAVPAYMSCGCLSAPCRPERGPQMRDSVYDTMILANIEEYSRLLSRAWCDAWGNAWCDA